MLLSLKKGRLCGGGREEGVPGQCCVSVMCFSWLTSCCLFHPLITKQTEQFGHNSRPLCLLPEWLFFMIIFISLSRLWTLGPTSCSCCIMYLMLSTKLTTRITDKHRKSAGRWQLRRRELRPQQQSIIHRIEWTFSHLHNVFFLNFVMSLALFTLYAPTLAQPCVTGSCTNCLF